MLLLDAVNACLETDGLSPVASLSVLGDPQVTRALSVVNRISKLVQTSGWSCNTDPEVTLALDVNGKVPLAATVLNIKAEQYNTGIRRVAVRKDVSGDMFAWNVADKTFVFSDPLIADVVYLLDFEDLTEPLAFYIAARAARVYQAKSLGAATSDKFASREEQEAYAALVDAEAEMEDSNVLDDSPFCALIARRNNYFFG